MFKKFWQNRERATQEAIVSAEILVGTEAVATVAIVVANHNGTGIDQSLAIEAGAAVGALIAGGRIVLRGIVGVLDED